MNVSAVVAKAPWHLRVVGILSLLWSIFGAVDFTMTNTRNAAYLAQFPPEMMQIIDAFPIWTVVAWGCGVWGAVIGSIALLLQAAHRKCRWPTCSGAIDTAKCKIRLE